jgi:hypothetical protein
MTVEVLRPFRLADGKPAKVGARVEIPLRRARRLVKRGHARY